MIPFLAGSEFRNQAPQVDANADAKWTVPWTYSLSRAELPNCVADRWRGGGFLGNFCAFLSRGNNNEVVDGPRHVQGCAEFLML